MLKCTLKCNVSRFGWKRLPNAQVLKE